MNTEHKKFRLIFWYCIAGAGALVIAVGAFYEDYAKPIVVMIDDWQNDESARQNCNSRFNYPQEDDQHPASCVGDSKIALTEFYKNLDKAFVNNGACSGILFKHCDPKNTNNWGPHCNKLVTLAVGQLVIDFQSGYSSQHWVLHGHILAHGHGEPTEIANQLCKFVKTAK